jgi:hypothetical protein
VTRYAARVVKVEKHIYGSPAVARILAMMRRADDEQLHRMIKDGDFTRMAGRLSYSELERLLAELRAMSRSAEVSR